MSASLDKEKGNLGEKITAIWLKRNGYKIVVQNYKKPYGELDIVAEKDTILHFIEVKTAQREQNSEDPFGPLVRVGLGKQRRFARIIESFLASYTTADTAPTTQWQIDIALVHLNDATRTAKISFMEDVILLDGQE